MRILIAPDKFKGSLTAGQAAGIIAEAVREIWPDAELDIQTLADGGEGTMEAVTAGLGGEFRIVAARDALGRRIDSRFGWVESQRTAVIEMAETAGMWRIRSEERDVWRSSTLGVGDQVAAALALGARRVLVGLGGSATNDAGVGMAHALGFRFLGAEGMLPDPRPVDFPSIVSIAQADRVIPEVIALSDVTNPLLGASGASAIFGPQKGLVAGDIRRMDDGIARVVDCVVRDMGRDVAEVPGAGAAGGLGFGLMAFCGAEMRSGFDWIADMTGLSARVAAADLVITAEGGLDHQTLHGKGPGAIARLAGQYGRPVVGIAGRIADAHLLADIFDHLVPLSQHPIPLEESIARAEELLRHAVRRLDNVVEL